MSESVAVRPRGGRSYRVCLGAGISSRLLEFLPAECAAAAVVSDRNVAGLHAGPIGEILHGRVRVETVAFPAGEANKTRKVKEHIEDRLIECGLGRDSTVVALGGGVTVDLAGFVASTFMRGVPWIAMPTSLLAAVDAGIGGKTGVNTAAGKNLVGTFHQPHAVLIDLSLLATLPPGEVDNGLAEMVKHAVIADGAHLDELVAAAGGLRKLDPGALAAPIRRSVEIKARVIADDPDEKDLRQVLNCGHTIAHAIEAVSDYRISHGRAVAAGLSVEAGIARITGLLDPGEVARLRAALKNLGLPVAPPAELEPETLLAATRTDKKGRRGRVRYALPEALGRMARGPEGFGHPVDDRVVLEALREVRDCSA